MIKKVLTRGDKLLLHSSWLSDTYYVESPKTFASERKSATLCDTNTTERGQFQPYQDRILEQRRKESCHSLLDGLLTSQDSWRSRQQWISLFITILLSLYEYVHDGLIGVPSGPL